MSDITDDKLPSVAEQKSALDKLLAPVSMGYWMDEDVRAAARTELAALRLRLAKIDGCDDHPEDRCQLCGGRNIVWFTGNAMWNQVVRERTDPLPEILCPICFAREHGGGAWYICEESELAALRTEIEELKFTIASLTNEPVNGGVIAALREENERLRLARSIHAEHIAAHTEAAFDQKDEITALCTERDELREALRQWTSTCRCHGTGTVASYGTERPCHVDYCKNARRLLAAKEENDAHE